MTQGGEFAFVLYAAALGVGLINAEGNAMLTAIIIVSMLMTPLFVLIHDRLMPENKVDASGVETPHDARGTALLIGWLSASWAPWWQSLTLMFQREVAERIVAPVESAHYGRLSVLAQWRTSARIALGVHRSAFTPPPKVMSAVVHLVPVDAPAGIALGTLERLTAAAFGQRRKMLRQSLKAVPGALEALEALGIAATRRAETVSVAEFVEIARLVGG